MWASSWLYRRRNALQLRVAGKKVARRGMAEPVGGREKAEEMIPVLCEEQLACEVEPRLLDLAQLVEVRRVLRGSGMRRRRS